LVGALVLAGCWIPENFDAKVVIERDGSAVLTYDGVLAFGPALAAAAQNALSPADEVMFKAEGLKLQKEPGFKRVEYLGKGRYRVSVERRAKPGERIDLVSSDVDIIKVGPAAGGTVRIEAYQIPADALPQLNAVGAKVEGTLSVSVARGV